MSDNTSRNDGLIYNVGNTKVSRTLAQIGGMSYPINGIVTVYIKKPSVAGLYLLSAVAAFIGLANLNNTTNNNDHTALVVCLGIAALLAAAAYSRPHVLVFRTASGNQQALSSRDKSQLFAVKQAIEQAVAERG